MKSVYNKKKIENWVDVQQEQLHVQLTDAQKEVEEYILAEMQATDTLEKKDIRKKAAEAKKKMDKLQHDLPKRRKEIQDEAQAEIDRFNQLQEINPLLLINIVLSDIVQIDSRADVIIFSSSVVTAKMDLMQRFFGFPVGKCYAENTFCRFKLWRGWSILICTFNFFDFCAITFNQSHPGEDSRKVRISRL